MAKKESVGYFPDNEPPLDPVQHIRVNARECIRNEDGTWNVVVPVQPLSVEHSKMLEALFPNTYRTIERALSAESLIACVQL